MLSNVENEGNFKRDAFFEGYDLLDDEFIIDDFK